MELVIRNNAFAAYLIATGQLKLVRIEAVPTGANIIFDDPEQQGAAIELGYLSGAPVPAVAYQNALRTLRHTVEVKLSEARKAGIGGAR